MPNGRLHAERLFSAINDGSFPAGDFSHAEHVRLAWYYLTRWPFPDAVERFTDDFERYIRRAGAESKYHHTITLAMLRLIGSHLDRPATRTSWAAFKADAEPLFRDALGLLDRHYSRALLFSDAARTSWQPPDKAPLPGVTPARRTEP